MSLNNKVLILGSSGLVGHQIYNYLQDDGDFNLSNISYTRKLNNETILLDARKEKYFFDKIRNIQPNYIINCIGFLINKAKQDPKSAMFINAHLPHKLAKLANDINSKLIHISTDCVFSGNKQSPYHETDEKDGSNTYAKTKSLGEIYSKNHLTIRTSVIGPEIINGSGSLFDWFMNQSGAIEGFTKTIWSGVTTIELAKAVKWFINNNIVGLYHLTNGIPIKKYDLLHLFKKYTNNNIKILKVDGVITNKSFVDTRQEINYQLPTYNEMVRDMVLLTKNKRKIYSHYNL
jgi:dTDP-4-dehydrorhamnose reductase